MRSTTVILALALSLSSPLSAQEFFPLHVGNKWQYESWFMGTFRGYYNIEILSDSTMLNGKHYYLSSNPFEWIRINDSLVTYRYDRFASNQDSSTPEFLIDRFQDSTGQSWLSYKFYGSDTAYVESSYPLVLFGEPVTAKVISYYGGQLWLSTEYYSSKHGLFFFYRERGGEYILTGIKINDVTYGTIVSVENPPPTPPLVFRLDQNYPNPFNPRATISYSIPDEGLVELKLYDLLGRDVLTLVSEYKPRGSHTAVLDATNLPSGLYFYRLTSGPYSATKKLVVLK